MVTFDHSSLQEIMVSFILPAAATEVLSEVIATLLELTILFNSFCMDTRVDYICDIIPGATFDQILLESNERYL